MDPILLIVLIFPVALVIIFAIVLIDLKVNKKKYDELAEQARRQEDEEFEREPEMKIVRAEVSDMVCGSGMVGSYRLPKSKKSFLVCFKTDEGEIYKFTMPEEFYLSLSIGDKGIMTLCDGNLDSFVLDEGEKNAECRMQN